jgi:hypothetical protein
MRRLDRRIHHSSQKGSFKMMDYRVKPGNDDLACLPATRA